MSTLENISKKGTEAVRTLRLKKLKSGQTFMINPKGLHTNQCYLEYPNGSIKLVTIADKSSKSFDIIRELSQSEANSLRQHYQLFF